jgi:hypothetical protein
MTSFETGEEGKLLTFEKKGGQLAVKRGRGFDVEGVAVLHAWLTMLDKVRKSENLIREVSWF